MEFLPKNIRYIDGAYWLVKIRWVFISLLVVATFSASNIFHIAIEDFTLYGIAIGIALENLISLFILKRAKSKDANSITRIVRRVINFQITADLIFLIIIIHFTGGIENPVYIFFVFHMVISGIMLSRNDSYLQTTFALCLIWLLAILEYFGIIRHYDFWLSESLKVSLYNNMFHIVQTLTIFSIASFMLVYIVYYIVGLLRKQEREYRKANKLLEQHDKIKDEYIQRVTHNIKGHISVIQTNLAILTDNMLGPVEPKQLEFIEIAFKRSVKLTDFVNDLLKLTQMRLSENMETEVFSLKELALSLFESMRKNAEDKKIDYQLNIDAGVDKIKSNPVPIEEIIQNLLGNAIKYTPENGKVEMNIRDKGDTVLIEVTDTGIGIPEDDQKRLFSEFFRASNARKLIKDGNGLGLALVKYIAKRYGGDITFTSKEGEGSTFSVILPKEFPLRAFQK